MAANTSPQVAARRRSGRALGIMAVLLVAIDWGLAANGIRSPGLDVVVLLFAPGLALAGLLPARVCRNLLALICVLPALGYAASSVLLITASRVGLELTATNVRALLLGLVLLGAIALPQRTPVQRPAWTETVLLAVALIAGSGLAALVLHGYPVPGNDWAKYLLYADEIKHQKSLLIDNPFWMLGVPFREDPGVPSVYGSFLTMSQQQTAILAHGIWIFALMGIASVFAYVRSFWGPVAGGLAALTYAVLPINQDILAWHGLANVAALALMPVIFIYAAEFSTGSIDRPRIAGFALLLVALAATHRLSFSLSAVVLVLVAAVTVLRRGLRDTVRDGVLIAAATLVIGAGVIADLAARQKTFGGTQGYQAYLTTKVDLGLVALDLSWPFVICSIAGILWALWNVRKQPPILPALMLLLACGLGAYSWVAHFPLSYLRMAYYLPLALVPPVAVAAASLRRGRVAIGAVGLVALAATSATLAVGRAQDVRTFYSFANPAAVRGLDAVAARLRPDEVVVTDRCWSFQSAWLLHTRVLPALTPEDIQPKAELGPARIAQQVLDGRPAGIREARRLGVRYVLIDPACVDTKGRPIEPPLIGRPIYASRRLVVLALPSDPRP